MIVERHTYKPKRGKTDELVVSCKEESGKAGGYYRMPGLRLSWLRKVGPNTNRVL